MPFIKFRYALFFLMTSHFSWSVSIDLETAVQRAVEASTLVEMQEYVVDAKEGEWVQAGLRPNPNVQFEYQTQNWSTKNLNDDQDAVSVGVSQLIEMGGKRQARSCFARSMYEVAEWDYVFTELKIAQKAALAFVDVAVAQEKYQLGLRQLDILEEVVRVVNEQVMAGKQTPIQLNKAKLMWAAQKIHLKKFRRDLDSRKERLAYFWYMEEPNFDEIDYPLEEIKELPLLDYFIANLEQHPLLSKWDEALAGAWNGVTLEYSNRVPDITLEAGVTEEDSLFGYFGISFPFLLTNHNEGNIMKAYAAVSSAELQRSEVFRKLRYEVEQDYKDLEVTFQQADDYQNEILKPAYESFQKSQDAFSENKLSYLDVLEAQRTYFDLEMEYLDLLNDYHSKKMRLEYVTIDE